MISRDDMKALAPPTMELDTTRKDWRDHLDKIVRLGDVGTRIVYWVGQTDVDPRGVRKEVFDVMRAYSERGKLHLYQRCVEAGVYQYVGEVR